MPLIRPRLTDFQNIPLAQSSVDFAIPFLEEDIPLYVDPFLLWKSPSQQDQALHLSMIAAINHLGALARGNKSDSATSAIVRLSECSEVGLGHGSSNTGRRVSIAEATRLLSVFADVPQLRAGALGHMEELALIVEGFSRDRLSDIACNLIKSFLIDFTIAMCSRHGIRAEPVDIVDLYDLRTHSFGKERVNLPVRPSNGTPVLFVPTRWLRHLPWINYEDYFAKCISALDEPSAPKTRPEVLVFNRHNYGSVCDYVALRERTQADCKNDPLFNAIPVVSAKRHYKVIAALPTGKTQNADRDYEDHVSRLLTSVLYPTLDFAAEQSRTDSGVLIRDLIFYNTGTTTFLQDLVKTYECRQVVFELKNVAALERDHVNQLNRYIGDTFGRFGVFVTRRPASKAIQKSLVDLWAGQRRCILVLTDVEIEQMIRIYEDKQRSPIDVLVARYAQFQRTFPG